MSFRQEHSSADGVSTVHPKLSGMRLHHSSAHHLLVMKSL